MALQNREIAGLFEEVANLLEIAGENPFRIRAYRNAARTLGDLADEVATLLKAGKELSELPGIGKELATKIEEVLRTGTLEALAELHQRIPPTISELLALPGVGPKKVKVLFEELGITCLAELKQAAEAGKVRGLPGMGAKTEAKMLEAIERQANTEKRFLRAEVAPIAESLVALLREVDPQARVAIGGSFRRARETVGDLDLLADSADSAPLMEALASHEDVTQVLAQGPTKTSVVLRNGLQVDLRVVEASSYGAALQYFTGSQAHNIAVRRRAQQQGMKVNEYGLTREGEALPAETEEALYEALGLPWLPPELREDRGEMELSAGEVPALVERSDLRGDLHMHSTASDGKHSIREMALAAREQGFEYICITDHSKRLTIVNGLDEERLLAQIDEIDRLNEELTGITILKGSEVDILDDGSLDLDLSVLSRLDLVIGSVHSRFNLSREQQTERVLRAMDAPCFTILAHPTGRLLLSREPYEIDVPRVLEHARQRGCFVELNSNPQRLDLDDRYCRMARDLGVLVSIDSDAHRTRDFDNLPFGIGQARRAWLEKRHVLNTRRLAELRPLLASTMDRRALA